MRNLHFPVLQLHGILYIIERRGIHLIFAKNKRIFFFKLSLPLLARSCENGPYDVCQGEKSCVVAMVVQVETAARRTLPCTGVDACHPPTLTPPPQGDLPPLGTPAPHPTSTWKVGQDVTPISRYPYPLLGAWRCQRYHWS